MTPTNPRSFQCCSSNCQQEYTQNDFERITTEIFHKEQHNFFILKFTCPTCYTQCLNVINKNEYSDFDNFLNEFQQYIKKQESISEEEMAFLSGEDDDEIINFDNVPDYDDDDYIPNIVQEKQNNEPSKDVSKREITNEIHEKKESNYDVFAESIKKIDKNLDKLIQKKQISDLLDLTVELSPSDSENCLTLIKDEFNLNARQIEAYRKEINTKKKYHKILQKKEENQKRLKQSSVSPKSLTAEEKERAIIYLRDPNLIDNLSRDITFASDLVGEEVNKMMLFFAAISSKMDKPISLVIFGQSSSGKSFLANSIAELVPPEDRFVLSSVSKRALEYLNENLKHKFLLIQEWEGTEDVLATIRTIQSEGKLNRLITADDPESPTGKRAVANSFECPCTIVFTTTKENIHDENSTRIFELYADDTQQQSQIVVKKQLEKSSLKNKTKGSDKKKVSERLRDIQRCLDKIEVDIPYGDLLTFPDKTTRNRRDVERFLNLIKVIAFIRQKQKEVFNLDGTNWIKADWYDYSKAYQYGLEVLQGTLNDISEKSKNVLETCCALADEKGKDNFFTITEIREKAPELGYDFNNQQDLYKQLDRLTEYEYLVFNQEKFRGKKMYRVCFDYVRDQDGKIINIDNPEVKKIITPNELRKKIEANEKGIATM